MLVDCLVVVLVCGYCDLWVDFVVVLLVFDSCVACVNSVVVFYSLLF